MSERGKPPACPICGTPRHALHRPFCSARCREIDLGRWFSGRYAVPAVEPPDGMDLDGMDEDGSAFFTPPSEETD